MVIAATTKFRGAQMLLESIQTASNVTPWADSDIGPPDPNNNDEVLAFNCLNDAIREVNSERNYQWNWTEDRIFTADGSGIVTIPANVARVDYTREEKENTLLQDRIVERNGQLYNATKETNNFGAGKVLHLKVTYWPDFKELPETVRHYVVSIARVYFIIAAKGADSGLLVNAERQKMTARAAMWKDHSLRVSRNIQEGDAGRITARTMPPVTPL